MKTFENPIRPEMEVCTTDGKTIGRVSQVYERATSRELASVGALPPGTPELHWTTDEEGYFKVHYGLPLLGRDLYIPFSAVDEVLANTVVLRVTRNGIDQQGWDIRPDFIPG